MRLGPPNWPIGSVIYRGAPKPNVRVVERREADAGEMLVVEEL
jgi:hypothetical protein